MANTEASLETFFEQIRSGKLINDKQRVFSSIHKFPGITLLDLSRRLKMPIQTVSARLSGLMDMGVVEVIGTQKRIRIIAISSDSLLKVQENELLIIENRKKRSEKKFIRAVKNVLSFEHHFSAEFKAELTKLISK